MADIYSPLRRRAPGIYDGVQPAVDEAAILEATTPRANAFERGLRSTAAGISGGSFANDALQAELRGDPAAVAAAQAESQRGLRTAAELAPLNDYRQVQGVGDAVDYAAGALGGAAASMAPVFAGGLAGRLVGPAGLRGLSSLAGAAVPGYMLGKGEAVANQYADPAIAALPAEQRDDAAMATGAASAALDALVPGGAAARLGRQTTGGVARQLGRDTLVEGATEAAQTGIGQYALGQLNPQRDTSENVPELINAGLQGMVGGAGMSAIPAAVGALAAPARAAGDELEQGRAAFMDQLNRVRDMPPAGSSIDAKAPTADIADQLAAQGAQGAQAFSPERLKQMGVDVRDSMAEWASSLRPESDAKRTDLFESVDPEDMAIARDLMRTHLERSRVTSDNISDLLTATSTMLAAFKREGAVLSPQKLHALGSQELFDHVKDVDAFFADIAARVGTDKAAQLGAVRTAEQDVRRQDNFLRTNLTPEWRAKVQADRGLERNLARMIDAYIAGRDMGRQDGKRDTARLQFQRALMEVVGTERNAINVLDYYERAYAKKSSTQAGDVAAMDTKLGEGATEFGVVGDDDADAADAAFADDTDRDDGVSEVEVDSEYVFRDPGKARPWIGPVDLKQLRATGQAGNRNVGNRQNLREATMLEYVRERGVDPVAEMQRLYKDAVDGLAAAEKEIRNTQGVAGKEKYLAAAQARLPYFEQMRDAIDLEVGLDRGVGGTFLDENGAPASQDKVIAGAERALGRMGVARAEKLPDEDQTATDEDLRIMQRGTEAANNKDSILKFRGPDGKTLVLNAREMLKRWRALDRSEKTAGDTGLQYAARQFNAAVAAVIARGYTLETTTPTALRDGNVVRNLDRATLPPGLRLGKIGGIERTFGELEQATRKSRFEASSEVRGAGAPRSDLERELLGDESSPVAGRIEALRDFAAKGSEEMELVLGSRGEVFKELDAAMVRLNAAKLPEAELKKYRGRMGDERRAYVTMFADLREDRASDDREGVVDAQVGGETLRGQDPKGVRIYDEDTLVPIDQTQSTAREGRKPKRVRPADPERTAAKLAPATVKKTARSSASGQATGPAKQVIPPPPSGPAKPETPPRFSEQDFGIRGKHKLSAKARKDIEAEIARLVGKDVKVAFHKLVTGRTLQPGERASAGVFDPGATGTQRLVSIAFNIGAGNARTVAQHEALHALFSMLRTPNASREMLQMADTLERVATSPAMQKKLAELLKAHPAALKQAMEDPEEAAAYMYQFWQAGLLTPPPVMRGIFGRVADYLRKVFGLVSKQTKAFELMAAFSQGKLAEPSTITAVLQEMKDKTLDERARLLLGPVYHVANSLITSTTDRLRQTGVPALRKLAREFHVETNDEGGKLAFLQKRAIAHNKHVFELNRMWVGVDKVVERQALEALQSRTTAANPAAEALRVKIRDYLDSMHLYLSSHGVRTVSYVDGVGANGKPTQVKKSEPLRQVKDYFPRAWNTAFIEANETEFRTLLGKYIVDKPGAKKQDAAARIEEVMKALVKDDKVELADGVMYTPYFQASSEIKLTFINEKNAADFAKFQEKDLKGILSRYTYQATHRAEYAQRFGNEGEAIADLLDDARRQGASPADLKMAQTAVAALTGTLGHDMNPKIRDLMVNVMTYQNIALLPFALINNFMDVVGIGVRSNDMGEAWNALKTGLKGLYDQVRRNDPDDAQKLAAEIGLIDDVVAVGTYGYAYEGAFMKGLSRKVADTFFRINGMQTWNTRIRVAAMMAGQNFIAKHAEGASKGDEQSIRFLKELNLKHGDVQKKPDGTLKVRTDDGLTPAEATQMQEAIFRFVDGAAVRPNAAHRPIWGSDPRYMLIFHLKQFTFSFQQVLLKYANKEAEHENMRPTMALLSYVPFAIFTDTFKSLLLGRPLDTSLTGLLATAAQQSALVGTGTFGIDAFADLNKNQVPGASFIGPTAGHIIQTLQTLSGSSNDSYTNLLLRSLPGGPVFRAAGLGQGE